ncbi:hypothetical protein HDU91_005516 [Kappamyces sp. JEL0680]|nr:hypothetical protein HDU91_005516 [Kappamyces sp. JEL0680]
MQRKRRPTDPSSSTEEEFQLLTEETTALALRRRHLRQTHQKSLFFHLLQYPILLVVGAFLALNLLLWGLARLFVNSYEFVFSFWSRSRKLRRELNASQSYGEWITAAKALDKQLGLTEWQKEPSTELAFDEDLLLYITQRMALERKRDQVQKLCETLRNSACKQDLAGVENVQIYSRCHSGTKLTVDAYVNQVVESLEHVGKSSQLSNADKAAFFKQVSITYGRTALCLSGGATFAWFHIGVMKALFDEGLLPSIITGTSAGSLMAAMVCCRTDEELDEIFTPSLAQHIGCLSMSWSEMFSNFYHTGALIDDEFFRDEAVWFTKGDMTFLEAYERTGRILNISVMSNETHSKTKLLNYINSPHITIRSAVVASSSIPGLLPACPLYFKNVRGNVLRYEDSGRLWRDGSMRADIPQRELHQLFRVKYTIVSQVNPHVSLFFFHPRGHAGQPSAHRYGHGWRGGFIAASFVSLFLLEINKWLAFIRDMELLPRISGVNFSNLWLQSFEGDLTILPTIRWNNVIRFLQDPDYERLAAFIFDGQTHTWPAVRAISNRMRIEHSIGRQLMVAKGWK